MPWQASTFFKLSIYSLLSQKLYITALKNKTPYASLCALKGNLSTSLKPMRLGLVLPLYRGEKLRLGNLPKVIKGRDLNPSLTSVSSNLNPHAVFPSSLFLHVLNVCSVVLQSLWAVFSFPRDCLAFKGHAFEKNEYPFHFFLHAPPSHLAPFPQGSYHKSSSRANLHVLSVPEQEP